MLSNTNRVLVDTNRVFANTNRVFVNTNRVFLTKKRVCRAKKRARGGFPHHGLTTIGTGVPILRHHPIDPFHGIALEMPRLPLRFPGPQPRLRPQIR